MYFIVCFNSKHHGDVCFIGQDEEVSLVKKFDEFRSNIHGLRRFKMFKAFFK